MDEKMTSGEIAKKAGEFIFKSGGRFLHCYI